MTKDELNELVTVGDLLRFKLELIDTIGKLLSENSEKEFYSPQEFSNRVGVKYSTVIHYCNTGQIKARQKGNRGSWSIHHSELERYRKEAENNILNNPFKKI